MLKHKITISLVTGIWVKFGGGREKQASFSCIYLKARKGKILHRKKTNKNTKTTVMDKQPLRKEVGMKCCVI